MNTDIEYINGRRVVKKHVATIHCCNRLSLLERKISNALLYHAYPNLATEIEYEISIESLKNLLDFNSKNTAVLKKALTKLVSTVIEWNLLSEKVEEVKSFEGWNASTILSSVSVHKGIIRYQYSELLKTLIINPSMYGRINLMIQSRFKSSYSLVLYENCVRYRGLPYTKNFDYKIFRQLLGVEDGKYETFRDFNRRVLTPAVTEINRSSDIQITPDITRQARKVKSIKFGLQERPIKKRLGQRGICRLDGEKNQIQNPVRRVGGTDAIDPLEMLVSKHGKENVKKAVEYMKGRTSFQRGEIQNVPGYIASILKNGYEASSSTIEKHSVPYEERMKLKASRDKKNQLSVEYARYKVETIYSIYSELSEHLQEEMKRLFISTGGGMYKRLEPYIKRLGFNNILVFESGFSEFVFNNFPKWFKQVLDCDDYIEQYN